MENVLTLYELNNLVAETINTVLRDDYWVEAELSEIREVRGHCYMELVQKDEFSNVPLARASAKCWSSVWLKAKAEFERVAGCTLRAGMKVMLLVHANFHEAYGFSWIVVGLNPEFTLGDMARRRREIINQLKAEGVFDLQKSLDLPMAAQRIAVVSSGNAAGYGDFCRHIEDNPHGYRFYTRLFAASMQGQNVAESIILALNKIYESVDDFDAVVIIRGGGAVSDLAGFDSLELSENVANFPIPVLTGIGHDRDESVLDLVAYAKLKTPTAVADFLVSNLENSENLVDSLLDKVARMVRQRLDLENMRISKMSSDIPLLFSVLNAKETRRIDSLYSAIVAFAGNKLVEGHGRINGLASLLNVSARRVLSDQRHRLDIFSRRIDAVDPARMLKLGYSLTLHNSNIVRNLESVKPGDTIETYLAKGRITSVVNGINARKKL